jgi:exoribonuclease R
MPIPSRYQITVSDREYKSWTFVDCETQTPKRLTESEILINPIHYKLFNGDIVDLSTPIPTIVNSPIRVHSQIPGVLVLEGNQTYGRTDNKKRLLYKCIPNDSKLPAFLVPFNPEIGFSKKPKNRFVIFRFDNWSAKHPHGILTENLGEVGDLSAFCEYQLYCRNVHDSNAEFNAAAKKSIKAFPTALETIIGNANYFPNAKFTHPRIFSIDPAGTADVDDAFSVVQNSPFIATVRVYIANVYVWLETLDLWKHMNSTRASTVYLPDFKRTMIPAILSESRCSLLADGRDHIAFCMEVQISLERAAIISHSILFYNAPIQIATNHTYESSNLGKDADYLLLRRMTRLLDPNIEDSHDVVAFWMIQMNTICGKLMNNKGIGIFRRQVSNEDDLEVVDCSMNVRSSYHTSTPLADELPLTLPRTTRQLISNWKQHSAQYALYDGLGEAHKLFRGQNAYVHITSPIRRMVDLLNQIMFQLEFRMIARISDDAFGFVKKWVADLARVNDTMKSIRKIQIDCDVLNRCSAHPEWMQRSHRGITFDRELKSNGMYSYMVHLIDLNILGRVVSREKYVNYQMMEFNIFVFEDADKIQRKIRLCVCD